MKNPFDNIKTKETRWHDSLPDDLVLRAKAVHKYVYPYVTKDDPDKWVDGFCYDMHPDREISIWEAFAAVFARVSAGKPQEKKMEAWLMLMDIMADIPVIVSSTPIPPEEIEKLKPQLKLQPNMPRKMGIGGGKSSMRLWAQIQIELRKRFPNA